MTSVDKINYGLRSFILREGVPRKQNFDIREGKLVCFTFRRTQIGLFHFLLKPVKIEEQFNSFAIFSTRVKMMG